MSVDKSDVVDTIEQILDQDGTVVDWDVEDVSGSKNTFVATCKIKHSRGFDKLSYKNVNGFDSIQFDECLTWNNEKCIKYDVVLEERT